MKSNKWRFTYIIALSLISLFFISMAYADDKNKKAKHWERAKAYLEKSEFREAVIELRNVIQIDPKDDAAYYELGEIYIKLKQPREAIQAFSTSVNINPENLQAQLKLVQILLFAKKIKEAREKAERILEKEPNNIEAIRLLAGAQALEKETDSAIDTLEKAISIDPNHFEVQLELARLYMAKGDLNKAEKTNRRAVSLRPLSPAPHMALSRIYAAKSQWEEAESELRKMVEASVDSNDKEKSLYLLAGFYEGRKDCDKAENTYKEALAYAPEGSVAPLIHLGAFYARRLSYREALEQFERASEMKGDDLNIHVLIAELHLDFRKFGEADAVLDMVLAKEPSHAGANFLKGRVYMVKNDLEHALQKFNQVVREDPDNAYAHYFKGLALLAKGEREQAMQAFMDALERNTLLLDARLTLARVYLQERNLKLAREQIEEALKLGPKNADVLLLQGNLKVKEGDLGGAESVFQNVINLYPDYAPGHLRLGLLYNLMKRETEALASFREALELNPFQMNALNFMVLIHLKRKAFDEALQICVVHEEKIGDRSRQAAILKYLMGRVYTAKGEYDKAKEHFEYSLQVDPNMLESYEALAQVYLIQMNVDSAISHYQILLRKRSGFLPACMTLGILYDKQGQGEKAELYYRKALEINKDFAPAANNLAWNLAERGIKIEEAFRLARLAKEKMPDNPQVMDTLGWIYYLKGSQLYAISELEESLYRLPEDPVVNYHLGKAYYADKQYDKAREHLGRALELDPDFKWAHDARRFVNK